MQRGNRLRWVVIWILVLPISVLHYLTPRFEGIQHLIYRELYLFPIFLASLWFGLRGGLLSSLAITVIYIPSLFIQSALPKANLLGNIMQMFIFNLFALTLGYMRDRDIKFQEEQAKLSSLAAVGQAVSCIAHDLKSPIMAIGGFAGQIRRRLDQEDPSVQKLDIIAEQAGRMETMVKDMLAFARPLELSREETDPNYLIRQVVEVAKAASEKTCQIEVILDKDLPKVLLDNNRMQQALLNLIINGVEASPLEGNLHVTSKSRQGFWEIEVSDHGPGIPLDKLDKLFTPFVTTKKGGTGLGLPITKKIIEAHGGSLSIKETSERGTTFLIRMPLSNPEGN